MIRFFVLFLVLLALLFGLELTPWVQAWFVVPWTNALAAISTSIVTLFDANVVAHGKVIRSSTNGFAVSIEAGCNGVEATLVLLAAILAFPAPVRHKILGLAHRHRRRAGLNVIRVISLFYIGQWNMRCIRVGAPVRLAGADHARRADRVADLGPSRAAGRRRRIATGASRARSRLIPAVPDSERLADSGSSSSRSPGCPSPSPCGTCWRR